MIRFDRNEFGCKLVALGVTVYERQKDAKGVTIRIFGLKVLKR